MKNLIRGLQILSKYSNNPNIKTTNYSISVSPTDKEIPESDVDKLIELNWCQDGDFFDEFTCEDYDPDRPWRYFVMSELEHLKQAEEHLEAALVVLYEKDKTRAEEVSEILDELQTTRWIIQEEDEE